PQGVNLQAMLSCMPLEPGQESGFPGLIVAGGGCGYAAHLKNGGMAAMPRRLPETGFYNKRSQT
ncbi:MAG: hypothetical protein VW257_00975, partial [Quisquiliibacterium sp.]